MGGLIEVLLGGLLVGVFTLLGVWVAGLQERKRAREAREARKEEMVYEKQLEVFEVVVKWLTSMTFELVRSVKVYEKLLANWPNKSTEEQLKVLEEVVDMIAQKTDDIMEKSREVTEKISAYLSLETHQAFQEYLTQSIASVKGMMERLRRGEEGDFEGTEERLSVAYKNTVWKIREHLDIRERIGGRRRLKLKFWASGRPTSRPKS